jgi:O-antigen/teichoic acid export membrane protein
MSTEISAPISVAARIGQAVRSVLHHQRNRRVVVSASIGVFQRVVQVGSTLIIVPLLLRVLGPAKFGVWGAVASLAWLSSLVDIGTGTALVTLIACSSALEGSDQARRQVGGALGIGFSLAGLTLVVVALIAMIAGVGSSLGIYLIAAVGLALNLPLNTGNNIWMALQKGYVSSSWELAQTLLTTGGLIATSYFTTDVRAFIAVVYAGLVLANAGSLIHLLGSHEELRPGWKWVSWAAMREVAGHGIMYFILALTGGLSFLLDNVLALAWLGAEASARMTIAMRICVTAVGALVVMSQPLWPAFAEAGEHGDRRWIRRALLRGSGFLFGLTIVGSALLLVFGGTFLRWWLHTDLGIGQGLLFAIAAWVAAQALIRVPNLLLNGLSILRYQIAVSAIGTSLAFGLKFVLARYFGVSGILWGTTAVVLVIGIPAFVWRIWRWAKVPGPTNSELSGNRADEIVENFLR